MHPVLQHPHIQRIEWSLIFGNHNRHITFDTILKSCFCMNVIWFVFSNLTDLRIFLARNPDYNEKEVCCRRSIFLDGALLIRGSTHQ
jgi:hypothetical protein